MIDSEHCYYIAAEVAMLRTVFSGTFLLVEGDKDTLLFEKFSNKNMTTVLPTAGKENALEAIHLLDANSSVDGYVAIVDADFWHIDGHTTGSSNILTTDYHDIELMIISSSAFDRFMAEYGSKQKISRFLQKSPTCNLREELLKRCLPVGLLRRISEQKGLALSFERLRYKNFMNKNSLEVDHERLILNVLNLTGVSVKSHKEILAELETLLEKGKHELLQVCCGHDLAAVVSVGLRKTLGSQKAAIANAENVEASLRLAYDSEEFKKTTLFATTKDWEKKNKPYQVFAI